MTCPCRSDVADADQDVIALLLKIRAAKSAALTKQRATGGANKSQPRNSDNRLD